VRGGQTRHINFQRLGHRRAVDDAVTKTSCGSDLRKLPRPLSLSIADQVGFGPIGTISSSERRP
jgi:hypothetical protein